MSRNGGAALAAWRAALLGAASCTALLSSVACSTGPDAAFHELAVVDPGQGDAGLRLPFDAYVIGLDKDNARRAGRVRPCEASDQAGAYCLRFDAPYFVEHPDMARALRDKVEGQHRPTYVSHIASFSADAGEPCFLMNHYRDQGRCARAPAQPAAGPPVAQSWIALDLLRADLQARLARSRPTHLVVIVMGWNTHQRAGLDSFRRLREQLVSAAAEQEDAGFRPLFIGVTWPSTGSPLLPYSDYGIKAKDADEVGAVWLNVLLHRVVAPVRRGGTPRVVVIGHSFGARATSRAAYSAALLRDVGAPEVDLLVGLQGAYSYRRFVAGPDDSGDGSSEGVEGAPYRDVNRFAGKVVLTASRHDSAVTALGHGPFFVGAFESFERTRLGDAASVFEHRIASADGRVQLGSTDPSRVLRVDASAFIDQPDGASGAHSDIYRPGTGRFLYQMIQAFAR